MVDWNPSEKDVEKIEQGGMLAYQEFVTNAGYKISKTKASGQRKG